MKLKIQDMQNILAANIYDKPFPTKTSYQIARLAKTLSAETATFEAEKQKLIEKHSGVLNEDKTQYVFSTENGPGFSKDMTDLLNSEVEVSFEPLPLEAFGDVKLTPNDLSFLSSIVAEA